MLETVRLEKDGAVRDARVLYLMCLFLLVFQSLMRSFFNLKDVGIVQVKILRAEGLMAADVTGDNMMSLPLPLN